VTADCGMSSLLFLPAEQRELYDVEGFYAAAEELELPFAVQVPGAGAPAWTLQQ